jgi:TM2 domain-containing membrane protein YozV
MAVHKCPACQGSLEIGKELLGATVSCPLCQHNFQVDPSLAGSPASAGVSAAQPGQQDQARQTKNCPYCGEEILAVARKCKHCRTNLDPSAGLAAEGVASGENMGSRGASAGAYDPRYNSAQQRFPPGYSSNRVAAGICAILIGSLGIHKFILGLTTPALIMLLVTVLTCGVGAIVMHIIGIAEGIIYLTKSDEEFYERYVVQKQEWF